jgi:hypothetical protein
MIIACFRMAETAASKAIATQSVQNPAANFEGATTGATFSKLPFELRSRIWHYSFPPPRSIRVGADEKSEYPVTLWINYESRTETLKYYVLFNNEIPQDCGLSCVRCFSPTRDMASFEATLLRMSLSIMFQPRFKFRGRDEGALGNFLKLEITDFKLNHGWLFEFMLEELDILLPSFSGMKEITFIGKKTDELVNIQQIEWYKKKLTKQVRCLPWTEDLKISFIGFEAD